MSELETLRKELATAMGQNEELRKRDGQWQMKWSRAVGTGTSNTLREADRADKAEAEAEALRAKLTEAERERDEAREAMRRAEGRGLECPTCGYATNRMDQERCDNDGTALVVVTWKDRAMSAVQLLTEARETLAKVEQERNEALQAPIDARQRVHDSFKRRNAETGKCECPYCTRDVDEIEEHAANLELGLHSAIQRAESAEQALAALRQEQAAPVLTRAEAEQRLTDEVVMAVFELLDWDTRAWSCDQARAVLLAALFPEGGQ